MLSKNLPELLYQFNLTKRNYDYYLILQGNTFFFVLKYLNPNHNLIQKTGILNLCNTNS